MPSGGDAVFANLHSVRRRDVGVAALHHYAVKSQEEFAEKRQRGHANSQDPARKRDRLDAALAEFDAGGVENTDMLAWAGRMRAEASRLQSILEAQGIRPAVWPFTDHR